MPYNRLILGLVATLSLATVVDAAPRAGKPAEGRSRAIDLLAEGQTLEQQGDRTGAYARYYESVQLAPSPSGYYHLGRIARLSGQKDVARQWLDHALQLAPNYELAKVELMQLNGNAKSQIAASPVVATVSNELNRTIAPGSADALNTPMNVDALRREVQTMQSMVPPDKLGRQPTEQEVAASAAAQAPESPKEVVVTDGAGREIKSAEYPALLSPTIDPKSDAYAVPSLAEGNGVGGVSVDELNEAAFGADSQKEPGSKGYGQTSKVALGTFAFHREKGDQYREAGRFAEAAVEYKTALELEPGDSDTRTLLAEMYGRAGDTEMSDVQFDRAKTQAPNDDEVYYKEGNAFFDQQDYDRAIGSYRQALDLNPKNKLALNNLGVSHMEKKEYAVAAEKFKQVLDLDPAYAMAVLNLGIIYDEHIIDKEQALKYYDRYLELKGDRSTEVERWANSIRSRQTR